MSVQKYLDNNEWEWKYTLNFFSKRKHLQMYLMSKFDVNELQQIFLAIMLMQ